MITLPKHPVNGGASPGAVKGAVKMPPQQPPARLAMKPMGCKVCPGGRR